MEKIYFDPRHAGSFKGAQKLLEVVKEEGKFYLTLKQIRSWLNDQHSYSLHKPVRRAFRRSRVIAAGMYDQYEADLADMQKLKDKNDGMRFLLIVVDVFSRFLWVEPLVDKTEQSVIEAFRKIFTRTKKPRRLRTDRGGEFKGQKVEDYFDSINVEHWSAHNDEMKANYAERVIRTLKSALWGYMRKMKNYRYVDRLQDFVYSYNNTIHRSIGMKPSEVTKGDVERSLWWHQYKPKRTLKESKRENREPFLFRAGDHVRISHPSKRFERAVDEKWTEEIFQIRQAFRRLGLRKYRLVDLQGEELKGTFYEGEMQKVSYSEDTSYEIERELRTRGSGKKKEILVKWRGWPDKFNSWILASSVEE